MESAIFAVLIFLLTVIIVTGIHELGHFCFARLFKIKVLKFSIGFGKSIGRAFDKRGTEYALSIIPLGGYVKLLDSRDEPVAAAELPNAFDQRPIYQRFFVLVAGPFFNFLLAIIAYWIIFIHGVTYIKPVVASVTPDSIAARAGIQPQDQIVAIDGRTTPGWTLIAIALLRHYGENGQLTFTVNPAVKQQLVNHTVKIDPSSWHLNDLRPDLITSVGIKPYFPTHIEKDVNGKPILPPGLLQSMHYSVGGALLKAIDNTGYLISLNGIVLYKMLTGVVSWHGLSGPVGIFQAAMGAAEHGLIIYLDFLALINISIGLINLLPIPGLDGAQVVYLIAEFIRGKPVSVSVQLLAYRLGLILLMIVMFQALLNDLLRLN